MGLGPNVFVGDKPIKKVRVTKALGIQIDEHLTGKNHVDHISCKISAAISALKRIQDYMNEDNLIIQNLFMMH